LRNAAPVGVMLLRHDGSGTAEIDLDYVTPPHRDFKAGRELFERPHLFTAHGITKLVAHAQTQTHRRYLARMGFAPGPDSEWTREVGDPVQPSAGLLSR
jgi:hypothetical protein